MRIYNQNQTDKLAEILRNDGIICVPTDTVFGVCARISSKRAHDNLVKIKNRPHEKLFPIMCSDEEQINNIALLNKNAELLIQKFMPGPITLVLKKQPTLPEYVNNSQSTVAIRMATSKPLEDLIKKTGSPVFMSSANKSGESTCKSIAEIERVFPTIDGIMDGTVTFGKASTIVDCTSNTIRILREGPINVEQILDVVNEV